MAIQVIQLAYEALEAFLGSSLTLTWGLGPEAPATVAWPQPMRWRPSRWRHSRS